MRQVLWRAATEDEPYFGRGSYWTNSEEFARWFRAWLERAYGRRHSLYRADVEVENEFRLPWGVFVRSAAINKRLEEYSKQGYLWVSFFEGLVEGRATRQYVYLGEDPIPAQRAESGT